MNRQIKTRMIKIIFIMIFLCITNFQALAAEQGVAIGGAPDLRQEVRPFVPIKGQVVIDPLTNQLILLFPKEEKRKIELKHEKPEIKTEKKVFPRTNSGTETGTERHTIKNRAQ